MKVIFDIDGTLNVWETGMPLEEVQAPGYFRRRTPHPNMVQAARLLAKAGAEVYTLSAVFPFPYSIPDKEAWLDIHLPCVYPKRRKYSVFGGIKSDVLKEIGIRKGDIYIDDYNGNLHEIRASLNGGVECIKCVCRGTNDKRRSWDGMRIYVDDAPKDIAEQILECAAYQIENGSSYLKEERKVAVWQA